MKTESSSGFHLPISGIYQIKNTINNKIYIGSSINIKQRFNDHKKLLRHNKHPNKHLQSSWVKYGETAFVFTIIEHVLNNSLIEREQFYIDSYASFNNKIGYNISKIAGNTLGTKRSEIQRNNLSLGKIFNNEEKINEKITIAINTDIDLLYTKEEYIRFFDETNPFYNKKHSPDSKEKMRLAKLGKPSNSSNRQPYTLSEKHKKNIGVGNSGKNNKKSKPLIQYDINYNLIKEWDSAGMAAKALSVSTSGIWLCCNDKAKTAYGFIWKYKK